MFVHPPALRHRASALIATGLSDSEVARRTGLTRSTVRDWRMGADRPRCPRCWRATAPLCFTDDDYAELLGLYLGDGCISALARTQSLRLSLDTAYPGIIEDALQLLRRCFPANAVGVHADSGATTILRVYSTHLACLFPQHGPGKKHTRPIRLEPWQWAIVRTAPWSFLRGCIRSDGCVFVNRTGRYEYLSYDFCNHSPDIRDLFVQTCALVGVECRPYAVRVRVYRRASVALLQAHVGVKS